MPSASRLGRKWRHKLNYLKWEGRYTIRLTSGPQIALQTQLLLKSYSPDCTFFCILFYLLGSLLNVSPLLHVTVKFSSLSKVKTHAALDTSISIFIQNWEKANAYTDYFFYLSTFQALIF